MSRVVVKGTECIEAVCSVLDSLNISYEEVTKKKNTYIFYKTPQEVAAEGVPFPIELEDSELLHLMTLAHEKNITFNELCNQVLREEIEKIDKLDQKEKAKKIKKIKLTKKVKE